ncbi:MAG TPA: type II secretion system F family protein [Phycisphaerae bacterium]|nr:type II secretion system F family protein [Phycisphaerae bacterium]HNU43776.1 type II secretion system F family protein [Phycisphaerae bacterium]
MNSSLDPVSALPVLAATQDVLFLVLPVLGSIMLSYGLYQVIVETRAAKHRKLQDRLRGESSSRNEKVTQNILKRGAMGQERGLADQVLGRLSFMPKLQTMLDQADIAWSASQMMVNLMGLALLVMLAVAVLQQNVLAAVGCGAAIVFAPLIVINFKRKRRISKLTNQLPDVFELMGQALRAGHSLASAIQLVQEQLPPPVATEFALIYQQQNLGMKIEDALLEMAHRVDSLDVRFFVTAVLIQRQTGGDLAEVLDKIGGLIRQRIELVGLVRGLTGEGRLSGWVLFGLPFVVFGAIWTLNQNYARTLLEEPAGKTLLMIAGGMQLMGLAMIRWIVNIKI